MIQQPPGSGHDQIDPLGQPIRLALPISATHDHPESLTVEPGHQVPHDGEDLECEFPRRSEDDDPRTVCRFKLQGAQDLDGGDEEGQGLSRPGPGGAEDVSAGKQGGDGPSLDFGHGLELERVDGVLRLGGEVERGEGLRGQGCSRVRRRGG